MKHLIFFPIFLLLNFFTVAQLVTNKNFSVGSYGRVGAGFSPALEGNIGRSLNLNGMGSVGGRMEEADYVELIGALHFSPQNTSHDTTNINVQARLAFYSGKGQLIGNVSNSSYGGIGFAMPELYAEAKNINGSKWGAWVGAKFFRGDDVHIADYFYFDDHSSQGVGGSYNKTSFAILFPGTVDTSNSLPPNFYINIVDGAARLGLRGRSMLVLEHMLPIPGDHQSSIKLLAEYHHLARAGNADTTTAFNYPSADGWVLGAKHTINITTPVKGSFNQFALRYGHGIANGSDGGNSKTFLTYGAPDLGEQQFKAAWSLAIVEHLLLNLSPRYSLNAYALYTKSRGAADSLNKAPDYFGRQIFNRKKEFALGLRNFWYIKPWFHLLTEVHYTSRTDGTQGTAGMMKFSIVPTFVPTAQTGPWIRPHLRLIYSVAKYNRFASDNLYSPYLKEIGSKQLGHYIGVRAEWWLF